jgi:hypothetical protein
MARDDRGFRQAEPGLGRSWGKTAEKGRCEGAGWEGEVLCLAPQPAVPAAAAA